MLLCVSQHRHCSVLLCVSHHQHCSVLVCVFQQQHKNTAALWPLKQGEAHTYLGSWAAQQLCQVSVVQGHQHTICCQCCIYLHAVSPCLQGCIICCCCVWRVMRAVAAVRADEGCADL